MLAFCMRQSLFGDPHHGLLRYMDIHIWFHFDANIPTRASQTPYIDAFVASTLERVAVEMAEPRATQQALVEI